MAGFNKVILMGNLTRDPELRYTPQGTAVTDLRLAVTTTRGGGAKGGEKRDETLFIDCTVWGRMAETCSEFLAKGRPVLVEGRLGSEQWEDRQSGEKRTKMKVVANTVQFLGGRGDSSGGGAGASGGGSYQQRGGGGGSAGGGAPRQQAPRQDFSDNSFDDFDGDDIPF